jgi:hypothetical protein
MSGNDMTIEQRAAADAFHEELAKRNSGDYAEATA